MHAGLLDVHDEFDHIVWPDGSYSSCTVCPSLDPLDTTSMATNPIWIHRTIAHPIIRVNFLTDKLLYHSQDII